MAIQETRVTLAMGPELYVINPHDFPPIMMRQLIELCADYYHGYDLAGDAIGIAKLIICDGSEDDATAERILNNMGFIASLMTGWKDLKLKTFLAKLEQVTDAADYSEDYLAADYSAD